MKGNQFNFFINFMPSVGNQSGNTAKQKIKRNLLMKLNGNLSLTLTGHETENSELKNLYSQCSISRLITGDGTIGEARIHF